MCVQTEDPNPCLLPIPIVDKTITLDVYGVLLDKIEVIT